MTREESVGVWEQIGAVAPGGTVFGVIEDGNGDGWLGTGAGIFHRDEGAWHPLAQGQPLSQVSALVGAGKMLFAGSRLGGITYSTDGGGTWYGSHVTHTSEPITCLVASPAFERDGVVLAGTDGAGILRSTDGGRNWRLSSFGLQDFAVLALVTAPEWDRREVVFAGTTRGLYRSPNGGRAWKRLDAGDWVFQALAVSPDFGRDRTVFAVTEVNGLFRSGDGGKSWQSLKVTEGSPPAINTIWLHPSFAARPICLIGTGDGRVFRSEDGGSNWTCVASGSSPVLCLAGNEERLYAGLHDQGLLTSEDGGRTWVEVSDLAARAITRLVAGPRDELLAWGPLEGVWRSTDVGETWGRVPGLEGALPLLALAAPAPVEPPCLLAGTAEGLLRSGDGQTTWQMVLQENVTSLAFAARVAKDGPLWAGTDSGGVLTSSDGGLTWTSLSSPQAGAAVVALAARAGTVAAATFEAGRRQVTVWRSTDGGQTWEEWLQEAADLPSVHLGLTGQGDDGDLVCVGRTCRRFTRSGWQTSYEAESPILRLCQISDPTGWLLLTASQVLRSDDGRRWVPYGEGLAGGQLADLVVLPSTARGQVACALGTGGLVWRRVAPGTVAVAGRSSSQGTTSTGH